MTVFANNAKVGAVGVVEVESTQKQCVSIDQHRKGVMDLCERGIAQRRLHCTYVVFSIGVDMTRMCI